MLVDPSMTDNLLKKHKEDLEVVANADCTASWIAKELLESLEGETTNTQEKSPEKPVAPNTQADNDNEKGIFAY